jgi:ParB/RepB/Spo0J family partition protein
MACPLPSIPLPPRSAPSAAHWRAEIEIRDIGLSGIAVLPNRLRSLRPEAVDTLAKSMRKQGLLQPIVLRKAATGFYLVAGLHRYHAAKKLGWKAIRAQIFPAWEEAEALLAEIDENLIRSELTPAQRAKLTAQRKGAYQKAHPETKNGATGRGRPKVSQVGKAIDGFVAETAAKSGRSKTAVARDATRAKALGADLDRVEGTSLDKGAELDALAAMPAPERQAIISRAASGEVSALQEAAAQTPRSGYFDLCRTWKSFRFAWLRANPAGREAFAEENFKQISGFVAETEPQLSIEEENGIRIVESIIVLSAAVLSANEAAARLRTTDASALFVKERLPAALAWINEFSDALNKTGCEGGDGHG